MTPKAERIPHLTVGQDQDHSVAKAFPLFILQYKTLKMSMLNEQLL